MPYTGRYWLQAGLDYAFRFLWPPTRKPSKTQLARINRTLQVDQMTANLPLRPLSVKSLGVRDGSPSVVSERLVRTVLFLANARNKKADQMVGFFFEAQICTLILARSAKIWRQSHSGIRQTSLWLGGGSNSRPSHSERDLMPFGIHACTSGGISCRDRSVAPTPSHSRKTVAPVALTLAPYV